VPISRTVTDELIGQLPVFAPEDDIVYNVTVTNTGAMTSDVSVLGFLAMVGDVDPDCPRSQLFDFHKLNLWDSASAMLMFRFDMYAAGCYDASGQRVIKSGTWSITLGDATAQFVVSS